MVVEMGLWVGRMDMRMERICSQVRSLVSIRNIRTSSIGPELIYAIIQDEYTEGLVCTVCSSILEESTRSRTERAAEFLYIEEHMVTERTRMATRDSPEQAKVSTQVALLTEQLPA
jgi:hypothetical protein